MYNVSFHYDHNITEHVTPLFTAQMPHITKSVKPIKPIKSIKPSKPI